MSRWLIDRARRFGLWSPAGTGQPLINRALPELAGALAIDVSPVAEFWFDRRDGTFTWLTDIPTYRPAGLATFIESAAPRTVQPGDGGRITAWPWLHRRWGLLLIAKDLHRELEVGKRRAIALAALQEYEASFIGQPLSTAVEDARWGVQGYLIGDRGDRAPGLLGSVVLLVKEDGQLAACETPDPDQPEVAAQSAIGNIISSMVNGLSGIGAFAFSAGQLIGQGLANGIDSMTGAVADAAQRLSNAAQAATQTVNAMHSPSEVYRQFGRFIGQGFALGMDDSQALVARSAAGMLGTPSMVGGSTGGNVTHGPVTNNFYITSTDPKAAAREVANIVWGDAALARQMQVGM